MTHQEYIRYKNAINEDIDYIKSKLHLDGYSELLIAKEHELLLLEKNFKERLNN